MKISSITCAYNEERTVANVIRELLNVDMLDEIVVVDNGSTDNTYQKIREAKEKYDNSGRVKIIRVDKNIGLGYGLREAIRNTTGDIIVRQDADLEYDPVDIPKVLQPIIDGKADASYGSRMLVGHSHRVHYFYHYLGNLVITNLINFVTNKHFSDVATAAKACKGNLLRALPLSANGFHIDWEITLALNNQRITFYEVPISYHGRQYEAGKKVRFIDGIIAIFYIIFRFITLRFKRKLKKE